VNQRNLLKNELIQFLYSRIGAVGVGGDDFSDQFAMLKGLVQSEEIVDNPIAHFYIVGGDG